jgi:putative endonuclease
MNLSLIMHQCGYFYIMCNAHNTVFYCGATVDLYKRVLEHKNRVYSKSFTSRYNIDKLVYYEVFSITGDAFAREKQIKGGSRNKKLQLIRKTNPEFKDLFSELANGEVEELRRLKKLILRP